MRRAQFRRVLASIVLPVMILASMSAGAAEAKTTGDGEVTVSTPAATPEVKPGRLRYRSAEGTCGCTCAKGGVGEADIRRAEEARASPKN